MTDEKPQPASVRSGYPGTGYWVHYLLIYPFIPMSEEMRAAVGPDPVFHPWLWFRTKLAQHQHSAQDDVLTSELCAQMVEIEAEGKRREAYAPDPDSFMQRVHARYHYEAALRWVELLSRQRADIVPLAASPSAERYAAGLDDRLIAVAAESITTRAVAEACGVPVRSIESQHGGVQ